MIISVSLKQQADTIILVAGDSDFVPAAKLARRERVRVIRGPLWQNVESGLFEHIDALRSGFGKPRFGAFPVVSGAGAVVTNDEDELNGRMG